MEKLTPNVIYHEHLKNSENSKNVYKRVPFKSPGGRTVLLGHALPLPEQDGDRRGEGTCSSLVLHPGVMFDRNPRPEK